jgi:hypothetical protein
MIIDFHTHVFSPRVRQSRERYVQRDPVFAELYSLPKARLATADELISAMERDGVDVSVILNGGWATQQLCVETNDYVLDSVARFPKRFIGFCTVQPGSPGAAEEIERCFRGGARGVGEMRLKTGAAVSLAPIADVIRERGLPLLVHASEPVGHHYQGKGRFTPGELYSLITSFPELTIVCAHWGGGLPFYALMPEVEKAMANVYFDTAASPFLYNPRVYAEVVRLVTADKVLFGTDWPLLPQRRLLREVNGLGLPAQARERMLSGNARKLLGMDRQPAQS